MTVVTLEVLMDGPPELCKEVAAVELEDVLGRIGRAQVRVTGVREERTEQLRLFSANSGQSAPRK